MGDDELPIHRFAAYEVEEEGLAGAVFADYQAKRRAAVGDTVQVLVECGDFGVAADLNVSCSQAGRDAGTQGLNESIAFTWAKSWAKHVEWLYLNGVSILRQLPMADGDLLKHDRGRNLIRCTIRIVHLFSIYHCALSTFARHP